MSMDRRGFFRLIGRAAALGVAAKVAPGLLVTQTSACPSGVRGVSGAQGLIGVHGLTGIQGSEHHMWTGCFGLWTGCQDAFHQKNRMDHLRPWQHVRPETWGGKLL